MSDSNDFVNFAGVPFWFMRRYIIVPPLNVRKVRELNKKWDELGIAPTEPGKELDEWLEKQTAIIEETIKLALRKNYSAQELSDSDIAEFMTRENMTKALHAAQGTLDENIPRYRSPGEVRPAEASPSRWTGDSYTGALPPASA